MKTMPPENNGTPLSPLKPEAKNSLQSFQALPGDILLETKDLVKNFGGIKAVRKVNLCVREHAIDGVIGPNGAGKTTLFNTITGLDSATSGEIFFKKENITTYPAHRIAGKGVARTFQNIRLFKEMTVLENVMTGCHSRIRHRTFGSYRFLQAAYSLYFRKKEEQAIEEKSREILSLLNLESLAGEYASNLPYGKQRELEIARALAIEPELLFLDEPAAGMNSTETEELMRNIKKIRDRGITIILIEHDMKLVMNICEKITVLNYGEKIGEGTPEEIKNNPDVIEAYLGKDE